MVEYRIKEQTQKNGEVSFKIERCNDFLGPWVDLNFSLDTKEEALEAIKDFEGYQIIKEVFYDREGKEIRGE